jgi:hypothetical protein
VNDFAAGSTAAAIVVLQTYLDDLVDADCLDDLVDAARTRASAASMSLKTGAASTRTTRSCQRRSFLVPATLRGAAATMHAAIDFHHEHNRQREVVSDVALTQRDLPLECRAESIAARRLPIASGTGECLS